MNTFQSYWHRTALLAALATLALTCAAPAIIAADEVATVENGAASNMMQQMQTMHAKMMAAMTPDERAALMESQMTMMESGMSMMQGMKGTDAMRIDMMQMMMDRMSAPATETQDPNAKKK